MNGIRKPQVATSLEVSDEEAFPQAALSRLGCEPGTGLVFVYPARSYATQKGLTLLDQVREYLPNAEYHKGLPARIMGCCREVWKRVRLENLTRLELTGAFDLGEQTIRFRVLSLPLKRPHHGAPLLVLLNVTRNDPAPRERSNSSHSQ